MDEVMALTNRRNQPPPFTLQVQWVCHDTLPWLIFVSLDPWLPQLFRSFCWRQHRLHRLLVSRSTILSVCGLQCAATAGKVSICSAGTEITRCGASIASRRASGFCVAGIKSSSGTILRSQTRRSLQCCASSLTLITHFFTSVIRTGAERNG